MNESAHLALCILHVPLGIEDPYSPQPWERNPREPRDGEPVSVAAVVRPEGVARSVNVEVRSDDGNRFTVPASSVPHHGEGDRWLADLGSFRAGVSVSYRFEAVAHDGASATSEPASFRTLGWHSLTRVVSWETVNGRASLQLCSDTSTVSTVSFEIVEPGVVRLRVWPSGPHASPEAEESLPISARSEGGQLRLQGAGVDVAVELDGGSIGVRPSPVDAHSPIVGSLAWLGNEPGCPHAVRLHLSLEEGEALFGTGERFDRFNRRGLQFDMRVYEQYKDQGSRTYLPIPFLSSSRGYGLSVEGTRSIHIDAGASDADVLELTAEVSRDREACLDALLFLAGTPLEALKRYVRHAGLPARPPDWAFGLWMSSNDWDSQQRVMREVERAEAEGVPGDVIVIEAWSDETTFYIWNDATYDPIPADRAPCLSDFRFPEDGRWPNPKSMVDALHKSGKRLLLWQIPLLKPLDSPHEQQAIDLQAVTERRWCALNGDGTVYRNAGWWFPGALIPDLTHPDATDWWLSRRRYLVDELGIDGLKTDGGEHLWGRDLRFADGRRGDEMINAFPVLYAAAYHRLLRETKHGDGLTFSRAGYAGSQEYPAHWAGDENSTWEAFRHSIVAGLTAGASGIPFWGWDIAGFSGEIPSAELYCRAWMMATFCPIMQYHSEHYAQSGPSRDRTPWNIAERTGDPDVLPVCRYYTAIRRLLKPYIVREADHSAATGRPLMCALPLAFPDDPACREYQYQYVFGRDLMVAPTVEEGTTHQRVYLPAGEWRDVWTGGDALRGPIEMSAAVPPNRIAVFMRADARPPLNRPLGEPPKRTG